MKSIDNSFYILYYIYHSIQCDKTGKFIHGKAFKGKKQTYVSKF